MSLGILLPFLIHIATQAQECLNEEKPDSCFGDCHDDSDCFHGFKCCQKDCGLFGHVYQCTKPVTMAQRRTNSQVCPTVPDYRKGDCLENCGKGCTKPGEMCCSNGCGQSCLKGVSPSPYCLYLRESIMALGPIIGEFIPQCEEDGTFVSHQCETTTGYCWCVDPETGIPLSEKVRFKVPRCDARDPIIVIKLFLGSVIPVGVLICFCIPVALHLKRMLSTCLKKKRERQILNYSVSSTTELYASRDVTSQTTNEQTHASPSGQQNGPSIMLSVEQQPPTGSVIQEAAPPSYDDRFRYKNVTDISERMKEVTEPPPSYDTVALSGRQRTIETGRHENVMSDGREHIVELAADRGNVNPET